MKQCIKCYSEDLIEVIEENRIFYLCKNCGTKEGRAFDVSGRLITEIENGLIKHRTAGALVKKNNKILLTRKRVFPYGLCIPAGHVEVGETPENTSDRELAEETGLQVRNKKLILHETFVDHCRAGADLHEWFLYEYQTKGDVILNSEMESAIWADVKDLPHLPIDKPVSHLLYKIGLMKQDSVQEKFEKLELKPNNFETVEESLINSIPNATLIINEKGVIEHKNIPAKELLEKSTQLSKEIKGLVEESFKSLNDVHSTINIDSNEYVIDVSPLMVNNQLKGGLARIKPQYMGHKQEVKDIVAYQNSLSASNSTSSKIINTILKQLLLSLDATACNYMELKGEILRVKYKFLKKDLKLEKFKRPINLKIGQGIAGLVAKTGIPYSTTDTSKDSLFVSRSKDGFSLLSIPVFSSNRTYGVLNITKQIGRHFTEEEVNMATIVANRIALAMENEELYKDLSKKNSTLEKVLDTSTDGFILLDKTLNILFANKVAAKMLPFNSEDTTENNFETFLEKRPDIMSSKFRKLLLRSMLQKKRIASEFEYQKFPYKTLKIVFNPIVEKNGQCNTVLMGINDITKLKEKQKTVEKQVKQLTALFKISSMSEENDTKFINKILDKTQEILESEEASIHIFPQKEWLAMIPTFKVSNQAEELINQIDKYENQKGDYISNKIKQSCSSPIRNLIGTPIKVRGTKVGILYAYNGVGNYNSADLKLINIIGTRIALRFETMLLIKEIERDGKQIEQIIANTGDGIIVRNNINEEVIIWNKAMEDLTGYSNPSDFIKANPENPARLERVINESLKKGSESIYKEIKIKNSDNQPQWLGVTYSFIKNQAGEMEHTIAILRDITREKALENRNKEFIYTTTHELRTPITAIKGYISMILNGDAGKISPKQQLYFNRVYKSTDKLVSLVEDLLRVARIESEHIIVDAKNFMVADMISEVTMGFKQKALSRNITLKSRSQKDLEIFADPNLTIQALANLVDNAIKYTPKGTVSINATANNGFACITVSDTGVGIPKKEQELIFTKFYRAQNSESVKAGGTGLGLFIVKNLIEKQGGEIDINSRLKKGTSISIILPLAKNKENK